MSDLLGFYMAVADDSKGELGATQEKIREVCHVVGVDEKGKPLPDYQQKQQAAYEKSLIAIPSLSSPDGYYAVHHFEPVRTWFTPYLYCDLDDCKDQPQRLPSLFTTYQPIYHQDGYWNWYSAFAWIDPKLFPVTADYDVRELNR